MTTKKAKPEETKDAKTPPNNLPAEAAVLGALLFDNESWERVDGVVSWDDFYAPSHKLIFQTIQKMIKAGAVADGVTLCEHFKTEALLIEIGGEDYLGNLLDSAAFGAEITDYARMVRNLSVRRKLAYVADQTLHDAMNAPQKTGLVLCAEARKSIEEIEASSGSSSDLVSSVDSATKQFQIISDNFAKGITENPDCIKTGIKDVDEKQGGIYKGDLIILAGRPGMCKTGVASNIALNAAYQGKKVVFFSLEMSETQTAHRQMSRQAFLYDIGLVEYQDIRRGSLGQSELAIIRDAVKHIPPTLLQHTEGGLSIDDIERLARVARRKLGGLDVIVIDYLQIMMMMGLGDNRVAALTIVTARLKALAKKMGVAILCLSQITRGVESRDDKRPMLADLRESGSIEQDADVVIMVYREEYYLRLTSPDKKYGGKASKDDYANWAAALDEVKGELELIFAKVRQGKLGTSKAYIEIGVDAILDDRRSSDLKKDKIKGSIFK